MSSKKVTILAYILLLISINYVTGERHYRFDYTYYEGANGWFKIHHIPTTWNEARIRCHAEGAVLASPLDESILGVMKKLITANMSASEGIFTGIHASIYKGVYFSIEGEPLEKLPVKWSSGEPNNRDNNADCLFLSRYGTMAEVSCNDLNAYMCYRKDSLLFHSKEINICDTFDNRYVLSQETGKCYKFHNNCKTWRTAYMICAAEGGHLAVVNSYTEARVIKEIFAEHTAKDIFCEYRNTIILGFWDWSHDNTWFTIHGETLEEAGYDEWSNGSPNNKTHGNVFQQCGGMFRSGLLDDVWCDDVVLPFVCEKSPRK